MPKKSKSKSSKKGKGKGKKTPKIEFCEDFGEFEFPTGDRYIGNFVAHKSGVLWRQGEGTYITFDGQVYEGCWKDDKLMEKSDLTIKYPNGDQFEGRLSKNLYTGPGFYKFGNGNNAILLGNFNKNKPNVPGEKLVMIAKDKVWYGEAGSDESILMPEHVFYTVLHPDLGKGEFVGEKKQPLPQDANKEILEKAIFGKSTKIPSGHSLEEQYNKVHKKLEIESVKDKSTIDPKLLLETYFSDDYKKSCRPLKVFYPSKIDFTETKSTKLSRCN